MCSKNYQLCCEYFPLLTVTFVELKLNMNYWIGQKVCSGLSIASYVTGEGNGTPLQYSCLANPTDGGAW